ncbi:MAG: cupin domain-containing protein [Gammaproteobacteria bacterium]|nr:cupin domain-containing protein [Gammaproteobacteria bacterium]
MFARILRQCPPLRRRQSLIPVLLLLASSALAQEQAFVTDLETVKWGPPGGGNGYPLGLRTARLGIDAISGGVTYYARFPAGSRFELHWHTHPEYVAVVQGEVDLQLGSELHHLITGSYVVIPGSMNHSWDVPDSGDVVILVRRAGPADFHFVEATQ